MQLVLDGLEAADSPYAFCVTQATDNSITFYERLGFVRVGAVSAGGEDAAADTSPNEAEGDATERQRKKHKKRVMPAAEHVTCQARARERAGRMSQSHGRSHSSPAPGDVAGGCAHHRDLRVLPVRRRPVRCPAAASQRRPPRTPTPLARRRYGVDVFEVVFLNVRFQGPGLTATTLLKKGTRVLVPRAKTSEEVRADGVALRSSWHVVEEDSTLKKEAASAGVDAHELLRLNRARLKGLQLSSMLLKGTKLAVSGSDLELMEYSHWTCVAQEPGNGDPPHPLPSLPRPHLPPATHTPRPQVPGG